MFRGPTGKHVGGVLIEPDRTGGPVERPTCRLPFEAGQLSAGCRLCLLLDGVRARCVPAATVAEAGLKETAVELSGFLHGDLLGTFYGGGAPGEQGTKWARAHTSAEEVTYPLVTGGLIPNVT